MANIILVFLEQRNGLLKKASLEAAKFASDLAGKLSFDVEAVSVGDEINNLQEIGGYGIKKVTHKKHSSLADYSTSAYTKIVSDFIAEIDADIVVFSNTALGKDLAPHLSVKMDSGIVMDAVECNIENGEIQLVRPEYGSKALTTVKITSPKKVITIRPNVFNPGNPNQDAPEIVINELTETDLSTKTIEIKKSEGKLDVAEAEIIVSGGRGMKGPEHFELIEKLADVLGAATGSSRAVVDAGWRPHSEQVGQTGKTVSPTLYVAVGISGAIQHLAGMRSSKYIVAINKDKDAPIFQVADYGIAGDAFEVLPVLIEELKKVKED
ncbi:MAG: electron transfer flavoprotein subunit alpha [Ignavibacteriae bacterium HGW-Ignavibacteriae-2]|nr:MAG: electron transfer flavoprotein subunit alpha [Ignavibacteriae bacterium HGW-Ignavibacteriae-2]